MIKTYSQRILNPYSGHVQVAESDQARAVSMDGENWEIHFLKTIPVDPTPNRPKPKGILLRITEFFNPAKKTGQVEELPEPPRRVFARVGHIKLSALEELLAKKSEEVDSRVIELAEFLLTTKLPFSANDKYEYWLLDSKDGSPLALIYSCSTAEEQSNFSTNPEWTALPAAVMPIKKNEQEIKEQIPPVNYRFERLVAEQAGYNPKARWFERHVDETEIFPPFLVKEDWQEREQYELCQRYLQRQSPRLLMLHGLKTEDRKRMELAAKAQALEVAKYFFLYPNVSDKKTMNSIRVEAQLRESRGEEIHSIKYRWS